METIGKFWQTSDGSRRRIYIAEEAAWRALEWDFSFYNTGNVSSASVGGEYISNTEARNMIHGLRDSSLYYDLADRKFHWKKTYNRDFTRDEIVALIDAIREQVKTFASEHLAAGGVS